MDETRRFFLGVSETKKWLNLSPGSQAYWCVYSKYHAQPGDLLALYRTGGTGVNQIYSIVAVPAEQQTSNCLERGMLTVTTQLVLSLKTPATAKQMRAYPALGHSGPIGRSFKGTTFQIRQEEWQELLDLLAANNPELTEQLQQLR